jgi:transposase
MNIQIKLKNKHSIAELKTAIKKSTNEGQKTRLRAIINLKKDGTRTSVAKELVVDRKTLLSWIKKYNKGSIKALLVSKGGRPKGNLKWDEGIFKRLSKEIKKSGKCWSLRIMQDWIKKEEDKIIPIATIWYHIQALGFTYTSLRPHPYLGDKKKQEAFKKGG